MRPILRILRRSSIESHTVLADVRRRTFRRLICTGLMFGVCGVILWQAVSRSLEGRESNELPEPLEIAAGSFSAAGRSPSGAPSMVHASTAAPSESSEALYHEAVTMFAAGEEEAAIQTMRQLAGSGRGGFPPAHVWLANLMISRNMQMTSARHLQTLVRHLEAASLAGDVSAKVALAQLYISLHRLRDAQTLLESIIKDRPDQRISLAKLLVLHGEPQRAAQLVEIALEESLTELQQSPGRTDIRVAAAECLLFLERFQEGIELLQEAAGHEEEELLRLAIGHQYLVWHDQRAHSAASREERWRLLVHGIQAAPGSLELWGRVAAFAAGDDDVAGSAQALLHDSLGDHRAAPLVHLILGSQAYATGNVEMARQHLEAAYALDATRPEIINNLAWYLATCEPPQLERALALANRLPQLKPEDLQYRETRGQILAKMGRVSEAITELEAALPVMRSHAPLHDTLAELYRTIGDNGVAEVHERRAAFLRGPGSGN